MLPGFVWKIWPLPSFVWKIVKNFRKKREELTRKSGQMPRFSKKSGQENELKTVRKWGKTPILVVKLAISWDFEVLFKVSARMPTFFCY